MMDPQHHRYSLKWNEFQSHVSKAFESLREQEAFTDITLGCEGKILKAHRVVLCASSPYLRQLLEGHESGHPIVFLKDVSHMDMEAILDFIYTGAVDLDQAQLQSFLSTAEALQIKGLTKADTFQDIDDKNSRLSAARPTDLDNLSRDSLPAKRPYKESSSSEEEEKNKEAIPLPLTDQNLNNVSSIEDMNIHCEDYGIQLQLPATKYEGDNFPLNASIPLKKRAKTVPVPSVLEKKDSAAQHKNSIKGCSEFVFNQRIVRGSRAGISKYGLSPDLKCSQCDKVFVHAASLIKHRSFHEGNTVCPFCNRVYSHKYTLREHVIREHGNRAHEVPSIAFKKTASRNSFKEMAFVPKVQSIVKPNLSESGSPDSLLPSLISSEDLSIKKEVAV